MIKNKNVDDNCYAQFIKKLNKIKKLAIESYVKDKIQKMIDSLEDISNMGMQERCEELRQIITKLQDFINQQKGVWFKLHDELTYESRLIKRIELKHRLKNTSKIIIKLNDVVEIMFNTLHKDYKQIGKLY